MKFIGRKAELAKLNAEYERDGSFVVIYGRRRVGKTTLIKEFLKKKLKKDLLEKLSIKINKSFWQSNQIQNKRFLLIFILQKIEDKLLSLSSLILHIS